MALKMLKGLELKEAVEKFKEMIYKQNGNIKKELENLKKKPKRNSGTKNYNN